jgi:dipeptidyl aminopeptidase/acylaminoacyl peptidase
VQLTAPEGKVSHASPKWSPDGSKISFVAQEGEDEHDFLVPFYLDEWVKTKTSKRGYTKNRIGILRAEGGPPTWIEAEKEPIAWLNEVVWSRDSRRILLDYLSKDTKTRTLMVADAELPAAPAETQRDLGRLPSPPEKEKELSIKARQVYREADPKWVYTYDGFVTDTTSSDFSRDASWILFTSEKSGFNQVYSVDVTGKKPKRITRGPGAVDWAGWSYDSRSIVTLASADDPARRSLFIDSLSGKNSIRLQASSTYLTHPVLSRGGDKVLYEGSRMGVPYDYYVADLASRTSVQVTRTVPGSFQSVEPGWVLPRIVSFPSRDGKSLRGLLYQPSQEGTPPGHRPVVIFVHGAGIQQNVVEGWTQYSPNFKFASVLVHRGFVVFEVDYRGSTGYGREFRTDVEGHLGGKDLEDELAGVDYLKTLPFVDPQRIGIYGGSYGGFMAELALFRNPEIFAAGAALRPVADWTNYYRSNVFYCMQRLGSPADHPEAYRISSPVNYAQGLQDPLLLLHGVLDSNVPFQDTVQLTDRLQRYGKPFELMIYPREDHTFTEPENWIDQYNRILDFFVRNLNP